jgi:hypothetical protein
VARLLATIVKRVDRLLRRRRLVPDDGASAAVVHPPGARRAEAASRGRAGAGV